MLFVQQPDHGVLFDDQDRARDHCRRSPDANGLPGQGALTEEVARLQHRHNRLFPGAGEHRELDPARLDVPNVVARVAL
jgi:hypothetical protein